ncbi:N-acetylmuramoyl-L-alanine amidase [Enterococcus sp. PF1-24]|uniref:N-acetylmuramoyl-L-alanine amidase n=1 Tax=unclassified Enterococcus TaxID=2608891 RepID=UPI0024749119|nr:MULTISPECIES: N-acetylmuramoyl-L-alanine amidase [unclassified Enterococcus]MDH6364593.1 N-acetylmuramoyl-L-alanine amidase [Enterococcus sp. PFB1-1]MDH6401694.1 N-acetylmuramoyl-L-alanine amidase [Enterococcus sp. PF1-24]
MKKLFNFATLILCILGLSSTSLVANAEEISSNYDSLTAEGQLITEEQEATLADFQEALPKARTFARSGNKYLIVLGHGDNELGAQGNGTNEKDFTRNELLPYLRKYAEISNAQIDFYDPNKNMYTESQKKAGAFTVSTSYQSVTELHLDGSIGDETGGHVIVAPGTNNPQDYAIANTLKEYVGWNPKYAGNQGLNYRTDLYNLQIFKDRGIPYRLVEIGFISNAKDLAAIRNNLDGIAKRIIEGITGEKINHTTLTLCNLETFAENNGQIQLKGWYFSEANTLQQQRWLVLIDSATGQEVQRVAVKNQARADVGALYPQYPTAHWSGFEASFPMNEKFYNKNLQVKIGYEANLQSAVTFGQQLTIGGTNNPIYRVYNPNNGEHFYTKSQGEAQNLVANGWQDEGVSWHAPNAGSEVYRLYNPNSGEHHYTLNTNERDSLVGSGWQYEAVSWYSADSKKTSDLSLV